jgi:hypothetical protein
LREGWLRVRGGSQVEWSEAGPLIRKRWDSQAQLVCDQQSTAR